VYCYTEKLKSEKYQQSYKTKTQTVKFAPYDYSEGCHVILQ
jgi:hypothetical protein